MTWKEKTELNVRILCSEEVRDSINQHKRPQSNRKGGVEAQEDVLRRLLEMEPREHVI